MPLQNRVNPFGELLAVPARGTFFGNRGGRFHTDAKSLTARRWASRQWICCVLDFKGRQRDVWGRFYTELFFLDEPTALAAGHRPCFECRYEDAKTFAEKWRQACRLRTRPYASAMDDTLHRERLRGRAKRVAPAQHRRATRRRLRGAGRGGLRGPRQGAVALDAARLRRPQKAAARRRRRCAHAAGNPRGAVSRLSAALASERGTNLTALRRERCRIIGRRLDAEGVRRHAGHREAAGGRYCRDQALGAQIFFRGRVGGVSSDFCWRGALSPRCGRRARARPASRAACGH